MARARRVLRAKEKNLNKKRRKVDQIDISSTDTNLVF